MFYVLRYYNRDNSHGHEDFFQSLRFSVEIFDIGLQTCAYTMWQASFSSLPPCLTFVLMLVFALSEMLL